MPLDSGGNYRHNSQVAAMHSKGMSRNEQKDRILDGKKPEGEETEGGEHTKVFNHGDGTFHTEHQGEEVQHGNIGEMHAHLSKIHGEPGEKHFHAHHDGFDAHSHAVETGGEPEHEEHDASDIEGLKEHLGRFFDEEQKEGEGGEEYGETSDRKSDKSAMGI